MDEASGPLGARLRWLAEVSDRTEADRLLKAVAARLEIDDVPATIGRFEVRRRIGSGGMGVVFEAWDPRLHRTVAVKLLRSPGGADARARLEREARSLARLRHPNVVGVYELGTHDDHVFVAMECVDGGSLRERLDTGPHPWSSILDWFIQAGRGLAAAHQAGIVHRDFKPANVLIGPDDRVQVADFGLAREPSQAAVETEQLAPAGLDADEPSLTRTGAVVGTPAYMAPEVLSGRPADARSDQFSYCVSLYQALFGRFPFPPGALADRLHTPVAMPRSRKIPRALRRATVRGLALAPDDRWPDMDALVAALERVRKRSGPWIPVVVTAAAGVGLWMFAPSGDVDEPPCMGEVPRLHGVWNPERAAAIGRAFAQTQQAYAGDAWTRAEAVLERYTKRWADSRRGACRATYVDGQQSEAMYAVRMQCLERALEELDALLDGFERPDAGVVRRAVEASHGLPALAECDDEAAVLDRLARTPLEDLRTQAPAQFDRLARLGAALRTGNYASGAAEARVLADEADGSSDLELAAEARLLLAKFEDRLGHTDVALAENKIAIVRAEQLGDARLRARSQTQLVALLAAERAIERAQDWAQLTDATLRQLGDPPLLRGSLAAAEGNLREAAGRHADAVEQRRAALVWFEQALERDDPMLARLHENLGRSLVELGQVEEGHAELEIALQLLIAALGEQHPDVAKAYMAWSEALQAAGDIPRAADAARRAIAIAEQSLGPQHVFVGRAHGTLAIALAQGDDPAEAVPEFRRALAIIEAAKGPEHIEVGHVLGNLGRLLAELEPSEAMPVLERALAIHEAVLGEAGHADTVYVLNALAGAQLQSDRVAESLRTAHRALEIGEKVHGFDHATVCDALFNKGQAERKLGRPVDARASLLRAVEGYRRNGARSGRVGQARAELALAWAQSGAMQEAVRHMRQARDEMLADPTSMPELAQVTAWLAAEDPGSAPR